MSRDLSEQYGALSEADPVLAGLVAVYGHPDPHEWMGESRTGGSRFAALVLHITGQQISVLAAFAVYDRIAAAAGGVPTPESLIALGPERLRECGLSRGKAAYVLDLARMQAERLIDVEGMSRLSDEEVIAELTAVRGIGLWTAEIFLVRQLHRDDVIPAGDVAVRNAVRNAWRLDGLPSIAEVRERAAAWSPYRSYATALLWRSLRPPDGE